MNSLKCITAFSILALMALPALAGEEKNDTSSSVSQLQTAPTTPDTAVAPDIKWFSYDEGLAKAKKEGKHIFIDFTAKWCGYCKKMDKTTFIEPDVVNMLNSDFISVKVDGDSEKELDIEGYKVTEKNLSRMDYKVRGYPTFWFVDPQGTRLGAVSGYQPAANLLSTLQFVKDKKYATEQKAASEPEAEAKKAAPDKN